MEFVENMKPLDVYESITYKFYEFVLENHRDDLLKILKEPNPTAHYPLELFFCLMPHYLAEKIVDSPNTVLPALDRAAGRALADLYQAVNDNEESLVFKKHIHVRFLSMVSDVGTGRYRMVFPGSKDVGEFMGLVGTVVRVSTPKLLEYKKFYRCNKCKQTMVVEAVASRCYNIPKIDKCENLCVGAKLEEFDPGEGLKNKTTTYSRVKDYQEVKLQEQISSRTDFGSLPKALWVILEDDLVDSCKPGDDVVITGTLFLRWKLFRKDHPICSEVTFMANHVEVKNDQRSSVQIVPDTLKLFDDFWARYETNPFAGRNTILRSICPHVYGMYLIKLAVCVVMAGGVSRTNAGARTRGESHLLLVGDPGTGKSQILKYVSRITPRSVFTTGAGTTNAGLTVAAVKDGGEWHLEAGALVLADSGVCCIDEFSHIKEHDRVSIHEAMEQQSISVAKAGMVCKLSTKCTVLAATNPKLRKYDPSETLEMNVGLASPLLSRFDLIIALKDAQNESWDEFLSDFILRDVNVFDFHAKNAMKSGIIWNSDTVQSYLVLIKGKNPEMTKEAHEVLSCYFKLQRKSASRNVARTTVRLLESLYRLAEGHARLMYRDFVSIHDAVTAVSLVEASMQSAALVQTPNTLHISFPENPIKEYYEQAKCILQTLDLPDLWETEKIYLENMMLKNSQKPDSSMPPPPALPPPNPPSSQQPPLNPPNPRDNPSLPRQPRHRGQSPPSRPSNQANVCSRDDCDSDNPYAIPETQENNNPVATSSAKASQQAYNHVKNVSQMRHNRNEYDSPELFPNDSCNGGAATTACDDDNEYGARTSTQNSNMGTAARNRRYNQDDEFDFDILSPIPTIIGAGIHEYPKPGGTVLQTSTQVPRQAMNGIDDDKRSSRSKRKRDISDSEETADTLKCKRVSSDLTSLSIRSGSNAGSRQANNGDSQKFSKIRSFTRIPNTQD